MKHAHILLGTLGGIIGIVAATATFMGDSVGYAVMSHDTEEVRRLGMVAVGFSVAGTFGAFVSSRHRGIGIGALVFSAAGGLLALSFYFLLAAVLFTLAAIAVPRGTQMEPLPAASGMRTAVDCPRCATRFAIPPVRPLRIECPSCGASGQIGTPAPTGSPAAAPRAPRPTTTPTSLPTR